MRQLKIQKSITLRESLSLEKYLAEIARIPMLSAEEEVQLAENISKGDANALERLVSANLRFVVSVAKQYQHQGISLSDLINEGNLGLIKAAMRFDPTRGFKFISYAVWWIRQTILQALAEESRLVRLPLNKISALRKIHNTISRLEQMHEREPSLDELAKELDLSYDEIAQTLKVAARHVSVDAPIEDGEQYTMIDLMQDESLTPVDEKVSHTESLRKELHHCMGFLSVRQREILRLYYGIGEADQWSLEAIAERMGLTRERVRQIRDKALLRLRASHHRHILRHYLG